MLHAFVEASWFLGDIDKPGHNYTGYLLILTHSHEFIVISFVFWTISSLTVLNKVSLKSYLANQLLRQHIFKNLKNKILDMKIGNIWKQIQRWEPHTTVHTNVNNRFELIYIMRSIISVAFNFIRRWRDSTTCLMI